MLARTYEITFADAKDAQLSVEVVNALLGKDVATQNVAGIKALLRRDGTLLVVILFDELEDLRAYDARTFTFADTLKASFPCEVQKHNSVAIFEFEREARISMGV